MTDEIPDAVARTFDTHEAFRSTEQGYRVETTQFETVVTVEDENRYVVCVRAPTLVAATANHIGETVAQDWFETLERRLEDATKATRATVELDSFEVEQDGDVVHVEYAFTWRNPDRALDIAKTFAEYVEGTYVEGIIPGYEYEPPVSELLADASQAGEGGTPL
jgi:hypothetical protein